MIVITFRGVCRAHDLDKTVVIKGAATPRQLDRGYDAIDNAMQREGCADYDVTYSISHVVKDHKLPA